MIEIYYRMLKHDPDGRLVKDTGLIPCGSYVIQFLEFVEAFFKGINKNATDVTGAESVLIDTSYTPPHLVSVDAGVGDDAYGIVVGTNAGSSPEDNEDYALDTKILHSAIGDPNKLNYMAVTVGTPGVVGPNVDFDISRPYLNESGGTISVKEIGLICENDIDTKYHLLLRDVVTQEDVLDGYTLTVVYTLRTTV